MVYAFNMSKAPDDFAANRASMGGNSRKEKLSPEKRKEIARKAAKDRWAKEKAKASTKVAGQTGYEPIVVLDSQHVRASGLLSYEVVTGISA